MRKERLEIENRTLTAPLQR